MWALHLAGDSHQPLHNNARITAEDPEGDRGGNSFRLAGLNPFNNLHALLGFAHRLLRSLGPRRPQRVGLRGEDRAAHRGSSIRSPACAGRWTRASTRSGRARASASRSASRTRRDAQDASAAAASRRRAWNAAEPRVALAGYRLADLLEPHPLPPDLHLLVNFNRTGACA